jgi:Flp pilus assembly protein TadG
MQRFRPMRVLAGFAADRSGAIAILFALLALPVAGMVGAAVDYGMAMRTHARLQRAADAAAFAALAKVPQGAAEVERALRVNFEANVGEEFKDLGLPFTMDDDPPRVTVTIETEVKTALLALIGFSSMPVRVESTAELPELPKTIRVPRGGDDKSGELQIPDTGESLPPEALAEARRQLRALGIDLSDAQIEELAKSAMQEMQRLNMSPY